MLYPAHFQSMLPLLCESLLSSLTDETFLSVRTFLRADVLIVTLVRVRVKGSG